MGFIRRPNRVSDVKRLIPGEYNGGAGVDRSGRLGLIQHQIAVFLPPAVVGLLGDGCYLARLRGRLSVRDFPFNLP